MIYLFIIGIVLFAFLWYFVKALKEPDVHKAANLGINMQLYWKLKELFDKINEDEVFGIERNKELYTEVVKKHLNEWKRYCLSREMDYKPFYFYGKEVFVKNKDTKMFDRGVIVGSSFHLVWWGYEVEFDKFVYIDNRGSKRVFLLSPREICDIETEKIFSRNCAQECANKIDKYTNV